MTDPESPEDYGTREITPEDRKRAVLRELINSEPVIRITPGMWRAIRKPRHRSLWQRISDCSPRVAGSSP